MNLVSTLEIARDQTSSQSLVQIGDFVESVTRINDEDERRRRASARKIMRLGFDRQPFVVFDREGSQYDLTDFLKSAILEEASHYGFDIL